MTTSSRIKKFYVINFFEILGLISNEILFTENVQLKNHTTVHVGGWGSGTGEGGWGRDHFPKDDVVFTDHFQKDDI